MTRRTSDTGKAESQPAARRGRGSGKNGKPAAGRKRSSAKRRLAGEVVRFLKRWAWRLAVATIMAPIILVPLYTVLPPVSTLMVWRAVTDGPIDRRWLPLDEIAPGLVASVLVSEDGRFCSHTGVDWQELNQVLEASSERPRGASTITMQTVKNVFLWQSRSVVRKAIEIPLAMFADTIWGKRRTMEIYLNVVEWGPGVFGAEAAARHHFGRSASRLTAAQSALLAVTLPNPGARDPARPTARLRTLARTVEARARASGAYTNCLHGRGSV